MEGPHGKSERRFVMTFSLGLSFGEKIKIIASMIGITLPTVAIIVCATKGIFAPLFYWGACAILLVFLFITHKRTHG